jgi:hypothetical protein
MEQNERNTTRGGFPIQAHLSVSRIENGWLGHLALPALIEALGFCFSRLASFSRIDRLVP